MFINVKSLVVYFCNVQLLFLMGAFFLGIIPSAASHADNKRVKRMPVVQLSPLSLNVQLLGGDFSKWGRAWKDSKIPQSMQFRWQHNLEDVGFVGWSIYLNGKKIAGPVSVGAIPPKSEWRYMTIPFKEATGNANYVKPYTYAVRIHAWTSNPQGGPFQPASLQLLAKSAPVTVTAADYEGSWGQNVALPKLKVTFKEVEVVDDSDDLSAGDLGFAFWVTYSGKNTEYQYHSAAVDSGSSTYPNKTIVIENPPQSVVLHAYGFDDDETEFLPVGPFIMLLAKTCGSLPAPNSPASDDCPKDVASGDEGIITGSLGGVQKDKTDFTIYANGASLRFKVKGYYELTSQ